MTARNGTSRCATTRYPNRALFLLAIAPLVFALGCSVEGLPPTVVYASPADGSGNVPVTAKITATFSASMDATTVTAGTFILTRGGIPIPGSVTCSGKTATFTPTNNLPGNSMFTATITTDAKDAAGRAFASNQVWTFMTVPVPTAGNIVLYYAYNFNGNPWTRSSTPVTLTNGANTVSQSLNPDGSVTITIQNAPAVYEDNGFYFYVGSLQYFNSLRVIAANGSGSYSANLFLDVDNDGEYFVWNPLNVWTGSLGADKYFQRDGLPVTGVLTLDSTTTFGGHTLAQLRAGAVTGVSGSTRAAIWLGFSPNPGTSQTITIVSITEN